MADVWLARVYLYGDEQAWKYSFESSVGQVEGRFGDGSASTTVEEAQATVAEAVAEALPEYVVSLRWKWCDWDLWAAEPTLTRKTPV